MNNQLHSNMKNELKSIAYYMSVKLSWYAAIILLIILWSYTVAKGISSAILYIILPAIILPAGSSALFYNKRQKNNNIKYYFPVLCQKYKYTVYKKKDFSNAVLMIYLMLILWYKFPSKDMQTKELSDYPLKLLSAIIIIRFLLYIYYYIIIKKELLNADY